MAGYSSLRFMEALPAADDIQIDGECVNEF